ncbi:uncharacterized protein LOC129319518 isoform X2 [Prosopis cineraria]|uniref:uncharacterized protein LOC129319518 isoform X2 n=1 Tax=Prosopis cineraria TaxID=364024 RepID=UPI00240F3A21|nr:uncharacterized protein LOC129319518 isoform X2 [Prosopis cineraria]
MGFTSFMGRVLFASVFILSAWQMFNEFDASGGPFAKELIPKLTVMRKNLSSKLGVEVPNIDLLHQALTVPLLYDFYNYKPNGPEYSLLLNDFVQNTALFGALLFFIGMKNSILKRQLKKKAPKTKTT